VAGHRTWYRVAGEQAAARRLPVLVLHGGPGVPHDYLEPLAELARAGRRVVFYDQLGCGRSDRPDDPSLWTIERFLAELRAVRAALGLDRVHLLGHSWGGMLAMEHALTDRPGLASLVIASAPASMRQWSAETRRLREALPAGVRETLARHEADGRFDDPDYVQALLVFYRRHVCRLEPWPPAMFRTIVELFDNPRVYRAMNGPSEFDVTGTLREWDIASRLGSIRVPTLVTSGRHDEATPEVTGTVHRGIPGARRVIFEHSAHMPHLEESVRYLRVVDSFLTGVEDG
jgi:proline-specific peptidase